jgi:hypothetical protein
LTRRCDRSQCAKLIDRIREVRVRRADPEGPGSADGLICQFHEMINLSGTITRGKG